MSRFLSIGTADSVSGNGTLTTILPTVDFDPGLPLQPDDLLICAVFVENWQIGDSCTTPTGWTGPGSVGAVGPGDQILYWYKRRVDSEPDPSIVLTHASGGATFTSLAVRDHGEFNVSQIRFDTEVVTDLFTPTAEAYTSGGMFAGFIFSRTNPISSWDPVDGHESRWGNIPGVGFWWSDGAAVTPGVIPQSVQWHAYDFVDHWSAIAFWVSDSTDPQPASTSLVRMLELFHDAAAEATSLAALNLANGWSFKAVLTTDEHSFIVDNDLPLLYWAISVPEMAAEIAETTDADAAANMLALTADTTRDVYLMAAPEFDNQGGWRTDTTPPRPDPVTDGATSYANWIDHYANDLAFNSPFMDLDNPLRGYKVAAVCSYAQSVQYAYDLGFDAVLLERVIDEVSGMTPGLAMMRGASRQNGGKAWGIDFSNWRFWTNSVTTFDGGGAQTGGWSMEWFRRHFYHAWAGGANLMHYEAADVRTGADGSTLNPLGREIRDVGDFADGNDRGMPVVPFAIVHDHYAGHEPKFGEYIQADYKWYSTLPYTTADSRLAALFSLIYPNYNSHGTLTAGGPTDVAEMQSVFSGGFGGDIRAFEPQGTTLWGESFDVLTDLAEPAILSQYQRIIYTGDTMPANVTAYVGAGGTAASADTVDATMLDTWAADVCPVRVTDEVCIWLVGQTDAGYTVTILNPSGSPITPTITGPVSVITPTVAEYDVGVFFLTADAVPDTTPPTQPTALVATAISATRIDLSWTASTDDTAVTGYHIFRDAVLIATIGATTTYSSTGLAASTLYTYTVTAFDAAANESDPSAEASATTDAAPPPPPPSSPAVPRIAESPWKLRAAIPNVSSLDVASADLTSAQDRTFTWQLDAAGTASWTMPGDHPECLHLVEMRTEAILTYNNEHQWRGILNAPNDQIDEDKYTLRCSAVDYRGALERRLIRDTGATRGFLAVEQADICWTLIRESQARPGGNWGITRGQGRATGVNRIRNFEPGGTIASAISDLGRSENGFHWEIDASRQFNIFYPRRGRLTDLVLAYGGNIKSVGIQWDSSKFASATRFQGSTDFETVDGVVWYEDPVQLNARGLWELAVQEPDLADRLHIQARANQVGADLATPPRGFVITLHPGTWKGINQGIAPGDNVRVIIRRGRLDIDSLCVTTGVTLSLSPDGVDTVTVVAQNREALVQ